MTVAGAGRSVEAGAQCGDEQRTRHEELRPTVLLLRLDARDVAHARVRGIRHDERNVSTRLSEKIHETTPYATPSSATVAPIWSHRFTSATLIADGAS